MDVRTGFNVYHYQGLPVYRCNLADSDPENPEVGYLLAANLGRDGVCLVHAYGTADTLGIQVDEEPAAPQQGQVRYVVHGAWTLFVFDPGAIICYGNVKPRPAREAEFSRPIRGAGRCPGRSRLRSVQLRGPSLPGLRLVAKTPLPELDVV